MYSEIKWDDIEKFTLPDLLDSSSGGVLALSNKLIQIYNYGIVLSQYEPEILNEIERFEMEIKRQKDLIEFYLDEGRVSLDKIPAENKKNQAQLEAYIKNVLKKEKYIACKKQIKEVENALFKKKAEYNEITRRLRVIKTALDTGRTIVSAMKEEIRNLDKEY